METGLLLENELVIFERLNAKFPKPSKHWLPIVWASSIVTRARKEGRIRDDFAVKTLIDELNKFRGLCGNLMHYDTISVPLVYTQVGVTSLHRSYAHVCQESLFFFVGSYAGGVHVLSNERNGPSVAAGFIKVDDRLLFSSFHDAAVLFLYGLAEGS